MHHSPLDRLKKRWKLIAIFTVLIVSMVAVLFVVVPFSKHYRSDSEILVIADSRYGVDPYTSVRVAERVGANLAQIVETSDFSRRVLALIDNGQINLDEYDVDSERQRRKIWQNNVEAEILFGTGILSLHTYHEDQRDASVLNQAIINTMINSATEYTGGDVTLKVINHPVATEYRVRPNLLLILFLTGVCSVLFGGLLFTRKRR